MMSFRAKRSEAEWSRGIPFKRVSNLYYCCAPFNGQLYARDPSAPFVEDSSLRSG